MAKPAFKIDKPVFNPSSNKPATGCSSSSVTQCADCVCSVTSYVLRVTGGSIAGDYTLTQVSGCFYQCFACLDSGGSVIGTFGLICDNGPPSKWIATFLATGSVCEFQYELAFTSCDPSGVYIEITDTCGITGVEIL